MGIFALIMSNFKNDSYKLDCFYNPEPAKSEKEESLNTII